MSSMKRSAPVLVAFTVIFMFAYLLLGNYFNGTVEKSEKKHFSISHSKIPDNIIISPSKGDSQEKCKSLKSLVYLKTHKTGSSSLMSMLQNILKKRKSCTNRMSNFPGPFYGGYPGKFRHELGFAGKSSYYKNVTQVDCILGHFRFDAEELRKLSNSNAWYISIMRRPSDTLESAFHYYYTRPALAAAPYYRRGIPCMGFPFVYVMGEMGVSYQEFLRRVNGYNMSNVPLNYRIRNTQSFDLGMDVENDNYEYVIQHAKLLDQEFDLILILEHFLESLILLKDMMCLEWGDIVPKHSNSGSYKSYQPTEDEQNTINRLFKQDNILYDYFNKTLWRKIEQYGRDRMKTDVNTLQKLIQQTSQKSSGKSALDHGISKKVNFKMLSMEDRPKDLKLRLHLPVSSNGSNDEYLSEMAEYMVANDGWCPEIVD